ncbi:hypothetical protein CSUI_008050 [Cystoisospora suis]|uniref:Uncharacterized protein n=1 Tax=Cystoisospora suis TaxID=483139 RepID=A0A2C6KNS2_9APIC|nr:hypothetical protein CSUI_008050 [Cystoisospora suis]
MNTCVGYERYGVLHVSVFFCLLRERLFPTSIEREGEVAGVHTALRVIMKRSLK